MRGLAGRYGVDHSEILNYEFEQANKPRFDHLNQLVYKDDARDIDSNKENAMPTVHKTQSNAIFERLTHKELVEAKRVAGALEPSDLPKISFNEWLRRKDAERRMRRTLLSEARNEIRQELFEYASFEQTAMENKYGVYILHHTLECGCWTTG